MPEEGFDLLNEEIQATYKTDPTLGTCRSYRCQIYRTTTPRKFTIHFIYRSGREIVYFVNQELKTVDKDEILKGGIHQRYDYFTKPPNLENSALINELRDKLAKVNFK